MTDEGGEGGSNSPGGDGFQEMNPGDLLYQQPRSKGLTWVNPESKGGLQGTEPPDSLLLQGHTLSPR